MFGICCTLEECGGPSEPQTGDSCTVDISLQMMGW